MRLSKDLFDDRLLHIIAAYLRLTRSGTKPENVPVKLLVFQYGFVRFTRTESLTIALKELVCWINRHRQNDHRGYSPSREQMLSFIKDRI